MSLDVKHLSPSLHFTHALFFEALEEIDKKCPSDKKVFDCYLHTIFLDVFTSTNSVGLMSLDVKIEFLESVMKLVSPRSHYPYYSYIYQALLIAANPTKYGQARTYNRSCYYTNPDTYIDHKGNCYPLAGDNSESEIQSYHFAAIRLLIGSYNGDKEYSPDYQLNDIVEIFENCIEYSGYGDCEVATIIAAEITLDEESINDLEETLAKFSNELSAKVKEILIWRKAHANDVYPLEQVAPPIEEVENLRLV